jgi:hypothetical protein
MKDENLITPETIHGWLQMDQMPFGKTLTYDLIGRGELESVVVGKVGTRRGRRLISLKSLNRYLRKQQKKEVGV